MGDERVGGIHAVIFHTGEVLALETVFYALALTAGQYAAWRMYVGKSLSGATGAPR